MAKRVFDIVFSTIGLILLLVPMSLLGIAVWWSMGRPVLFEQTRVGRHGREFRLRKFRSMREDYDAAGQLLPDEERITRFGRFLRRSRLDELPELWMILRGDMSFVGPRPLPRAVLQMNDIVAMRSRVRPGLTGLAQVSGNTLLTNEEKFAADLLYASRPSILLDINILYRTLTVVAKGEFRDTVLIKKALDHAAHLDRRDRQYRNRA